MLNLRFQSWASYALLRLGVTGLVGVGTLALALTFGLLAWVWQQQADALVQQSQDLRAALTQPTAAAPVPVQSADSFLAQLPPEADTPQFIETLHQEAARAKVRIERAEYRAPRLASGRVSRTEVVLPVQGRYADVARWLSAVLYEHPSVALDQLSLQRDAAGGPELQARVVLSHYSRSTP